jgi:hypothetical protein
MPDAANLSAELGKQTGARFLFGRPGKANEVNLMPFGKAGDQIE